MKLHPVILCGGSGSRLWPLSRDHHPKQLLPLFGTRSLLQETVLRLEGLSNLGAPVVVSNSEYRFLIAEQMRERRRSRLRGLRAMARSECITPSRVWRPWGFYESLDKRHTLSGQTHHGEAGRRAVAADALPPR